MIKAELSTTEHVRLACVRVTGHDFGAERDVFVWAVRLPNVSSAREAKVVGAAKLFVRQAPVCLGVFDEGDQKVIEFEFVLPYFMRFFSLSYAGQTFKFSKEQCQRVISEHYETINNAVKDDHHEYAGWYERHQRELANRTPVDAQLTFSIVTPLFNTPASFFHKMVRSVLAQTYTRWELVLVNASPENEELAAAIAEYADSRIKVFTFPNQGIAANTNFGIAQTTGDYVCFLDHDDIVSPHALMEYARAIEACPQEVSLLYCDDDMIDENDQHFEPILKPDYNPDLLYSNNYVLHWLTVSRSALMQTERSASVYDGAQDYDLTLAAARTQGAVVHVPAVLYSWRKHRGSVSVNPDSKPYAIEAGRLAIVRDCDERGLRATSVPEEMYYTYKTLFKPDCELKVAVFETGDSLGRDTLCGSADAFWEAVDQTQADILFVQPQDTIFSQEDIDNMVGYFSRARVFSVSPRLVRKDSLAHYSNLIVSPEGRLLYLNRLFHKLCGGYIGRSIRPYDSLTGNPECIALRVSDLRKLARNPYRTLAYTLVDICMQAYEQDLLNVYTPFAEGIILEHRSMIEQGDYFNPEDAAMLCERFGAFVEKGDVSHNPSFDPRSAYYKLRIS